MTDEFHSNDKIKLFLRNFLERTKRKRTLKLLEKDWHNEKSEKFKQKSHSMKLSFDIIKAPARQIELKAIKSEINKRKKKKNTNREGIIAFHPDFNVILAAKKIPEEFMLMATRFGLPKTHLDFFYSHRENFHWEIKDQKRIACTGNRGNCKFTTEMSSRCLVDHMITVHNHGEFECDQIDCKYVAFSSEMLNKHIAVFHGTGKKVPSKHQSIPCKYSSCSHMAVYQSNLVIHHQVHENNLPFKCQFCTYRAIKYESLNLHMLYHFKIQPFECNICNDKFYNEGNMILHKRIHTSDFSCSHCFQNFEKSSLLAKHTRICSKRLEKFKN